MTIRLFGLAVLMLLTLANGRAAAAPILEFTSATTSAATTGVNRTFGWSFSTTQSLLVSALGFWDEAANGLGEVHQVGLWADGGGSALATVTVSNASDPVPSTNPSGRWMFTDLVAPLLLLPGNYVLGAEFSANSPDPLRNFATVSSVTTTLGVTYTGSRVGFSATGFVYPETIGNLPRQYFGPNLSATTALPVPEPTSLLLFGTVATALAANARRRKKQQLQ